MSKSKKIMHKVFHIYAESKKRSHFKGLVSKSKEDNSCQDIAIQIIVLS